jgi:hypothetical protein
MLGKSLSPIRRVRSSVPIVPLLLTIALFVAGCADSDNAQDPSSKVSDATGTATTLTTATEPSDSGAPVTGSSTTRPSAASVTVYFSSGAESDCSEVIAVERSLHEGRTPLESALTHLVGGPTGRERSEGASSWFSPDTASTIALVRLNDGQAVVGFMGLAGLIPNASTSCGSEGLLAQLNATILQFPEVDLARYEESGSCETFMNWLQRDCVEFDDDGVVEQSLQARADGSGCALSGDRDVTGRFYGSVSSADSATIAIAVYCWFSGAAAGEAAAVDGADTPSNGYYVRTADEIPRTFAVAGDANAQWLADTGDPATFTTTPYETWLGARPGREFQPGVWIDVDADTMTGLSEQYVP